MSDNDDLVTSKDDPDVSDSQFPIDSEEHAELNVRTNATHEALTRTFRAALVGSAILLAVVAAGGCIIGFLVAGMPGLYGALVGAGVAAVFCGATILSFLLTAKQPFFVVQMAAVVSWLVKVVVVIIVMVALRNLDFYSPGVLFGTVVVAVIGTVVVDSVAVLRGRVPYIEPASNGSTP